MQIRNALLRTSSLFLPLAIVVILTCPVSVRAQSSETVTTNSIDPTGNTSPTRTIVTKSEQDGRTVETRRVEGPSINGGYGLIIETEQQTTQVNPNTVTVVTRQYSPDSNGNPQLVQVTEEQRHTAADGRETVVRTLSSSADLDGHLQIIKREVQETVPTGNDTKQTTSTTFQQIGDTLQPVQRSQQTEQRKADVTEQQTTVLNSDGNGNFVPLSRTESTSTKTASGEKKDERAYWQNDVGKMTLIKRDVTTESKDARGTSSTTQTYSAFVPGASPDSGSLVLVQQVNSSQQTTPDGSSQSQQQVQQINLGNPSSGLQPAVSVTSVSEPVVNGQSERKVVVRSADGNGGFGKVLVTDSHETKVVP
jgi:hypothetical protein